MSDTEATTLRAVIYGSDSYIPDDQSVDDQIGWARELCAQKGWEIVGEYRDDKSGMSWSGDGTRSGFKDCLDQLKQKGEVDVFVICKSATGPHTAAECSMLSDTLQTSRIGLR